MEESLTNATATDTSLNQEPTGVTQEDVTMAETNQETNSGEHTEVTSQETVTDDGAAPEQKQTEQNSGKSDAEDGVAKFAKSQGIEWSTATENEKRLAKVAYDNQKAARQQMSQAKLTDATKKLNQGDDGSITDSMRLAQLESKIARDEFFRHDGIDASIEPAMVDVLNKTRETSGVEVARMLSQNLPLLYKIAKAETLDESVEAARQQGRQEERASITAKTNASAPAAHARTQSDSTPKITREWVSNNPNYSDNPETLRMVEEAIARGDLY